MELLGYCMYSVTDPDFCAPVFLLEIIGVHMYSVTDPDFCAPVFLLEIIGVHLTIYGHQDYSFRQIITLFVVHFAAK